MPVQPQLFPEQEPVQIPPAATPMPPPPHPSRSDAEGGAPVWLQRTSLFVLVLFCVYLGVLVMVLPWWPRMWDQNMFIEARPQLSHLLHMGAVRGFISGLGALDIWIGVSEAVHYRETRG
jgi:hypothetical protein